MQLTVLVLCFALFLECFSQDITEAVVQSSTESPSTGTQGIDWDTTSSPKRTTVYDGRRGQYQQTARTSSDYTTLFPNPWAPRMLPMLEPPFGSRIQNQDTREDLRDTQEFYPYIRRPDDFPVNFTTNAVHYPTPSDAVRHPMTTSYLPYPPVLFYPRPIPNETPEDIRYPIPSDAANPVNPLTLQDLNEKQNISASSPSPYYYGLPNTGLDQLAERFPFPYASHPLLNFYLRNRAAGRNLENNVPFAPYAIPPGFYPPSLTVPAGEDGLQVYPEVNVFVRPPYVDREPGFDPEEPKEPLPRSDSVVDAEAVIPPNPSRPADIISSGALPSSPLPLSPFPFGLLPPGLSPRPQFPFPQSVIPPTNLPPRPLPNAPVPPVENLLTSAIPPRPALVPSSPLPPVPQSIPPPPPPADLPPPGIQGIAEDGIVPEVPPTEDVGFSGARTPYEFGFDMNDGKGTDQHRQESADEAGVVTGSYGYRDFSGVYRIVNYIADKKGFRAFVQSNEPGVANPGSADVVVMAERPPPQAVAESLKQLPVEAVEVPEDLLVQASEKK